MQILEFLHTWIWPGSLWTPAFPGTFVVYLFGCTLVFSRSLQWRAWKGNQLRWIALTLFLAATTVLNGPVIYTMTPLGATSVSYFPLLIELVILIYCLYNVTESSRTLVTVVVAMGYAVEHIAADIVQILGNIVYQTQYDARFADPTYKVYTFLIYATIALSVWLVIGRKTVVDEDVIHDRKRWIAICIVVFFFVVFANSFGFGIIVYQRFSIVDSQSLGFLSALLFTYDAICSLMILIVLLVVSSRNHLIREVEVLNDINRRQQKHYEISQEYRDIINMKMHDLKKSLAHEGSSQFSNSPQTVRALQETLKSYDALFHTGSSAVDTILNDKSLYCAHRGITLQCLVNGAALSFMEEADIYSLVGNIMDNAIEAVESIDSDELSKSIMLNISHEGTMIVLRETNQFSGDIVEKNGVIQSKKDDATNHGFGMRSVQFVVRKYGGQMSFSTDNNTFDLTIILPAHSN